MKRIFLLIAALTCLVSCQKNSEPTYSVVGVWELTSIDTKSAILGTTSVNVTLTLSENGSFSLEQVIGEGRSRSFSGSYTYTDGILSGKYSDGSAWGDKYSAVVTEKTMTLTSSSGKEIDTYRRK